MTLELQTFALFLDHGQGRWHRARKFPDLLADLALHRLDLVMTDEPMSGHLSIKAFNPPWTAHR